MFFDLHPARGHELPSIPPPARDSSAARTTRTRDRQQRTLLRETCRTPSSRSYRLLRRPRDDPQHPSGDGPADIVLKRRLSHEHAEAIHRSQPFGSWWDADGPDLRTGEIGDKCAYYYGKTDRPRRHPKHNRVINGHEYYAAQVVERRSTASRRVSHSPGSDLQLAPSLRRRRSAAVSLRGRKLTGSDQRRDSPAPRPPGLDERQGRVAAAPAPGRPAAPSALRPATG